MNKLILTTIVLTFFSLGGFSQNLNKQTLCKKWHLEKYEIMWIDYAPEENEKNDYIQLKSDMTYISVDEGVKTTGRWTYNSEKGYFTLYDEKGEGVRFLVDELETSKMVVNIDIEELEGVDIHFSTQKK